MATDPAAIVWQKLIKIGKMDLFNADNQIVNVLPYEGVVHYYGPVLTPTEAQHYLNCLLHINKNRPTSTFYR